MYTHVQRVRMTLQTSIMQIHMHERMRNALSRVFARKRMDSLFAVSAVRDSYTPSKFIEFAG